jgi:hypothetical protein
MIYALAAGVTCSLLVQRKVTKRNTPQAARPSGSQSGREFSEGTSVCLPKTTHILCAAPAGFNPSRLPRLNGAPKIKSQSQSQSQSQSNINININIDVDVDVDGTWTGRGRQRQRQRQQSKRLAFALALAVALDFWGPL